MNDGTFNPQNGDKIILPRGTVPMGNKTNKRGREARYPLPCTKLPSCPSSPQGPKSNFVGRGASWPIIKVRGTNHRADPQTDRERSSKRPTVHRVFKKRNGNLDLGNLTHLDFTHL